MKINKHEDWFGKGWYMTTKNYYFSFLLKGWESFIYFERKNWKDGWGYFISIKKYRNGRILPFPKKR